MLVLKSWSRTDTLRLSAAAATGVVVGVGITVRRRQDENTLKALLIGEQLKCCTANSEGGRAGFFPIVGSGKNFKL